MIELLYRAEPPPDETFGITHIAFMSDDLDADYARLTAPGYKGLVAPRVAGSGVGPAGLPQRSERSARSS